MRKKRSTADAKRGGRSQETATERPAAPASIEGGKPAYVIRDSFTMPVADYELIAALKQRCLKLGIAIKKSELLRAGIATLYRLSDESLTQVVAAIESVKTGRPPGGKKKLKANRAKGKKQ